MVQVALQKGINVLHQHIPQWSIEKELFVRLTPCRNCYGYDHRLKDCKVEKKVRCTYCAGEHKQNECKANQPCCINCGGQHRTLAAACKIRKELIKQKSGDIRANARSQSQHRQYSSYATAATGSNSIGPKTNSNSVPGLTKNETKEIITTIMSAIVFSHYVEAIEPGSFQRNMNEMFKKNGLKPVNFPTPPMNDVILQSCREVFTFPTDIETETDNTDPTTENDDTTFRPVDKTSMTTTSNFLRFVFRTSKWCKWHFKRASMSYTNISPSGVSRRSCLCVSPLAEIAMGMTTGSRIARLKRKSDAHTVQENTSKMSVRPTNLAASTVVVNTEHWQQLAKFGKSLSSKKVGTFVRMHAPSPNTDNTPVMPQQPLVAIALDQRQTVTVYPV